MPSTGRDSTGYNIQVNYTPPDNPYGAPLIGYYNVITNYAASTSATGHPASNMGNNSTASTWQATSTGVQRITLTVGQSIDWVGIAAHNFANDNTAIGLSWTNNVDAGLLYMLLHFEGTNGSNMIVDTSGKGEPVQAGGNAQIDTSQFKWGASSCKFDGTGDFLRTSASPFAVGTDNYSMDMWVRLNTTGTNKTLFDCRGTGGYMLQISNTNVLLFVATGSTRITGTTALTTGQWYHVAISRNGTSTKLFLNGTQEGSTYTDSTNYTEATLSNYATIGTQTDGTTNPMNGWIDEFRWVLFVAYFTANFTPPAAPYFDGYQAIYPFCSALFHFDGTNGSTVFTDDGGEGHTWTIAGGSPHIDTAQSKFGGSSLAMTGTGKLQADGGETYSFGLNDFTIDFWVRLSVTGALQIIYDQRDPVNNVAAPVIYIKTDNKLYYFSAGDQISGTTVLSANTWYHVALTRSGQVARLFLNGVQEGSNYTDNNFYVNARNCPLIGDRFGTSGLQGWLDEFRIVKGVALFTRRFDLTGAPYSVSYSPGGRISVDAGAVVFRLNPSNPASPSYIALDMAASRLLTPSVGIIWAGTMMVMERGIKVDTPHVQISYGRKTNIVSGMSESGQFLGRVVISEWHETVAEFAWITSTWYENNFKWFLLTAQENPFFWVWSPAEFPAQCAFVWLSEDVIPEIDPVTRRIAVKLPMRGLAWG